MAPIVVWPGLAAGNGPCGRGCRVGDNRSAMNRAVTRALVLLSATLVGVGVSAQRRDVFIGSRSDPAIGYSTTPATDPVARMVRRINDGSLTLARDPATGYLKSILEAL